MVGTLPCSDNSHFGSSLYKMEALFPFLKYLSFGMVVPFVSAVSMELASCKRVNFFLYHFSDINVAKSMEVFFPIISFPLRKSEFTGV